MQAKKDIYQEITDRIVNLLEQGIIPWQKGWDVTADAGAFTNLVSGKPYRGVNTLLLLIESLKRNYTSPYWMTFKQISGLGGRVRKGERATSIYFYKPLKIANTEIHDDGTVETMQKTIPLLRTYQVFNLAQCDGIEAPAPAAPRSFTPVERAEELIANMPNRPVIHHAGGRAFYRPASDEVVLPAKTAFHTPAEYYSTAFHELGHATGAKHRLNRPGVTQATHFGDDPYAKEELVAELTSAFLCGSCGLGDMVIDNQAAYLQGWLKALKDDKRFIMTAATQAQKAADYIRGLLTEDTNA